MLLDDLRHIFRLELAVEGAVGIDHDGGVAIRDFGFCYNLN